jgi:hypothetical protein
VRQSHKEDSSMESTRLMHLAAVVAVVIALFVSVPAHSGPVTTSLQVPLAGTVFVPLNNR